MLEDGKRDVYNQRDVLCSLIPMKLTEPNHLQGTRQNLAPCIPRKQDFLWKRQRIHGHLL